MCFVIKIGLGSRVEIPTLLPMSSISLLEHCLDLFLDVLQIAGEFQLNHSSYCYFALTVANRLVLQYSIECDTQVDAPAAPDGQFGAEGRADGFPAAGEGDIDPPHQVHTGSDLVAEPMRTLSEENRGSDISLRIDAYGEAESEEVVTLLPLAGNSQIIRQLRRQVSAFRDRDQRGSYETLPQPDGRAAIIRSGTCRAGHEKDGNQPSEDAWLHGPSPCDGCWFEILRT